MGGRRIRCGLGAAALALAVAVPAASHAETPQLQASLDAIVGANGGPPGASALIQRGDETEFLRSGVADLRTGRAFHRSDHMRIASIAKAFSGAAALALVDRGRLDLDDTLGDLLPGSPPAWSRATLAQLMQHTSGIPSYIESEQFGVDFSADPRRYFSPRQLIEYVADEPPAFPPGSAYEYSNTDNILIGLIVEKVTGRVYSNGLRQLVYRPLGLKKTSLPSDWRMPRRFIHGYDVADDGAPEDVSGLVSASGAWASGGIVSTPFDLNKFMRGYGSGALFGADVRSRQLRFVPGCGQPPGPGECSAGLSIYRYRTDCGTVLGHTGNFPGYTQFAATSRNGRRSVVVTASHAHNGLAADAEAFEPIVEGYAAAVCALFS